MYSKLVSFHSLVGETNTLFMPYIPIPIAGVRASPLSNAAASPTARKKTVMRMAVRSNKIHTMYYLKLQVNVTLYTPWGAGYYPEECRH